MSNNATQSELTDVLYQASAGVARVTINRPDRLNAIRGRTVDELVRCFKRAWADRTVGVIVLSGAGDRAFCVGGDQKQRAETGDYGPTEHGIFELETLHRLIRDVPKPVIAAVNGMAIGGGHVMHVLCDITVAVEDAKFGQVGPKVGSFDPGFGCAYLARILGEKRAREVWYTCRQYDAAKMEQWGLVNSVVSRDEFDAEVKQWCDELLARSPTALRVLKHAFNADSESIAGIGAIGFDALELYQGTAEADEGVNAFTEHRDPDFSGYR